MSAKNVKKVAKATKALKAETVKTTKLAKKVKTHKMSGEDLPPHEKTAYQYFRDHGNFELLRARPENGSGGVPSFISVKERDLVRVGVMKMKTSCATNEPTKLSLQLAIDQKDLLDWLGNKVVLVVEMPKNEKQQH